MNLTSKFLFSLLFLSSVGCTSRLDNTLALLHDELNRQYYINGCLKMFIYLKQNKYVDDQPFSGDTAHDQAVNAWAHCEAEAREFQKTLKNKNK